MPKIKLSGKDLYIHIRSNDIFNINPQFPYAQPPLCFYEKILSNFKYNRVYIIASDTSNPVILKLINKYHNVIYKVNNLKIDISLLIIF